MIWEWRAQLSNLHNYNFGLEFWPEKFRLGIPAWKIPAWNSGLKETSRKFRPEKQARIPSRKFWPEMLFRPADVLALTDKLSVERIANEFVSRKEERLRIFGKFWTISQGKYILLKTFSLWFSTTSVAARRKRALICDTCFSDRLLQRSEGPWRAPF